MTQRGHIGVIAAALVAVVVLPGNARAQVPSATLSMTVDRTTVPVGETFRLTVRADIQNGGGDDLQIPDLSAFRIVNQRTSSPMQFRFGFGSQQRIVQASVVHDYTLMPVQEGRVVIQPAKLQLGARTFSSNGITVDVTPGQLPQGIDPSGSQNPGTPPAGPLDGATFDSQAFVRTVVSESEPFVGEQVTVTVYLYTRSGLRSQPMAQREPSADGFWVHDLLSPTRTMEPHTQVVNGLAFQVYVLRRFAAFPLREGQAEIGPMAISWDTGSVFNLFGNNPQQSLRREGVAVPLGVRPLPAGGRPGPTAVGVYELETRLDRTQVATGDAVTLTASLTGTGNVRDVQLALPAIDGLRALQPQIRDEVTAPSDLVRGTRTWEWLVVPEREGSYTIPSLSVSTFDPRNESWNTAQSRPISLVAAGSAVNPALPDSESPILDEDGDGEPDAAPQFGPVHRDSELSRHAAPLSRAVWYPWALGVPPLAWLLFLGFGFLRRRARARGAADAPRRAVKSAKKRLAHAEKLARGGDPEAFYGEIQRVLREVLEVRLGEQVGGHTHPELRRHLAGRGMDDDLVRRLVDEIEGSEFARFSAAGASPDEIDNCTERVGAILTRLDKFSPVPEKDA